MNSSCKNEGKWINWTWKQIRFLFRTPVKRSDGWNSRSAQADVYAAENTKNANFCLWGGKRKKSSQPQARAYARSSSHDSFSSSNEVSGMSYGLSAEAADLKAAGETRKPLLANVQEVKMEIASMGSGRSPNSADLFSVIPWGWRELSEQSGCLPFVGKHRFICSAFARFDN